MVKLWVISYNGRNIPSPEFFPDWEAGGIEVVASDIFWVIAKGKYLDIERVISGYTYLRVVGHPADGRWVSGGGDEVYIADGAIVDSPEALFEHMGLNPRQFGGEGWEDVDWDVVWDCVPVF